MPALTGWNLASGTFGMAIFTLDSVGNLYVLGGSQAASLANVVPPVVPGNQVPIGAILVSATSAFTGGTTALDAVTTTYLNFVGAASWPVPQF